MFLFRLLPCNVILRTELQSCQESDKCAYRKARLKLGSKMAAHRSACILGALISSQYKRMKTFETLYEELAVSAHVSGITFYFMGGTHFTNASRIFFPHYWNFLELVFFRSPESISG